MPYKLFSELPTKESFGSLQPIRKSQQVDTEFVNLENQYKECKEQGLVWHKGKYVSIEPKTKPTSIYTTRKK